MTMVIFTGNGGTPAGRVVTHICNSTNAENSYIVPDDETVPSVGDTFSKKTFDKYAGWTELQNSDKTSARLIEDLYDFINGGTASEQLTAWVNAKKAAREKYNTDRSR